MILNGFVWRTLAVVLVVSASLVLVPSVALARPTSAVRDVNGCMIIERPTAGFHTECPYQTLRDVDLSHVDLSYANFGFASLEHANLTGADLKHADLVVTRLDVANFSDANLSYAALKDANLTGATLRSGSAVGSVDTGFHWSGSSVFDSCSERQLELDRGELAEAALTATVVVGVLDPVDDGVGEVVPRPPSLPVEDVLLEQ